MKKIIYVLALLLCTGLVSAKLFNIDGAVTPTAACSLFGCVMYGDIYMNGYTIYNATFVNATLQEHDPIFNAWLTSVYYLDNASIWNAINTKLNQSQADALYYPLNSNPAGYLTNATLNASLPDLWVNITGDTMTGDLNMSNHNITDVDTLYVHNISGRSPIHILSEVISNNSITAQTFYGDIQGQNGTIYGVTITNGTITNLQVSNSAYFDTNVTFNGSLIPAINNTYSLGIPDKVWKNFYVQSLVAANISSPDIDNLYILVNAVAANLSNETQARINNDTYLQQQINALQNASNTSVIDVTSANNYIKVTGTNNKTLTFNESLMNTTINNISQNRKMTYTASCTGPNCNVTSPIIYYQITQVKVEPSSNSNYNFQLTEYPTITNIIDRDLSKHKGIWDISKNYAINGQTQASIINGNNEQYNITIVYIQNGVQ